MKKNLFLLLFTLILTACNQSKPSATEGVNEQADSIVAMQQQEEVIEEKIVYNTTDALMMGLKGNVQKVVLQFYPAVENNGKITIGGDMYYEVETAFNERGQVTKDEWKNVYEYDENGNFIKGNSMYTALKRDKEGRLIQYKDEVPNGEYNEDNMTLNLAYDTKGRLQKIEYSGCYEGYKECRFYQNNNLYPSKISLSSYEEAGGGGEEEQVYTYRHFDDMGNWTERVIVCTASEVEEYDYEDDDLTSENIFIEKRVITYY